jgi:hypothetical protein
MVNWLMCITSHHTMKSHRLSHFWIASYGLVYSLLKLWPLEGGWDHDRGDHLTCVCTGKIFTNLSHGNSVHDWGKPFFHVSDSSKIFLRTSEPEKFKFMWKFYDMVQFKFMEVIYIKGRSRPQLGINCIFVGKIFRYEPGWLMWAMWPMGLLLLKIDCFPFLLKK